MLTEILAHFISTPWMGNQWPPFQLGFMPSSFFHLQILTPSSDVNNLTVTQFPLPLHHDTQVPLLEISEIKDSSLSLKWCI
jgi:hypothetical protein